VVSSASDGLEASRLVGTDISTLVSVSGCHVSTIGIVSKLVANAGEALVSKDGAGVLAVVNTALPSLPRSLSGPNTTSIVLSQSTVSANAGCATLPQESLDGAGVVTVANTACQSETSILSLPLSSSVPKNRATFSQSMVTGDKAFV
jgi:hypothetical protein